jgi:phage N-6-adenine-methyltransferase
VTTLFPSPKASDERATPQALFDSLHAEFAFTIDVAASFENAKCLRFYNTLTDGLSKSWAGERVWCNPPYSDLVSWVQKAHDEVDAESIVMLIPANRTEQPFWQELVEPYRDNGGRLETRFLARRTRFVHPVKGPYPGAMFGCVLLIWRRG